MFLRELNPDETEPDVVEEDNVEKGDGFGTDYRDQGDRVVTDSVGELSNARNPPNIQGCTGQGMKGASCLQFSSTQIV